MSREELIHQGAASAASGASPGGASVAENSAELRVKQERPRVDGAAAQFEAWARQAHHRTQPVYRRVRRPSSTEHTWR
jgi:hypothetical protein